jgi:hypothetical protein
MTFSKASALKSWSVASSVRDRFKPSSVPFGALTVKIDFDDLSVYPAGQDDAVEGAHCSQPRQKGRQVRQ